ncbi:MAG TPA: hypothetical protein VHM91_04615 [Verrucomicrobiales bacterium]|nr:hypothetical protein [Verrucomicrobiales bacterium]
MPATFAGILSNLFYKPILRPIVRLGCGLVAIPLFRFVLRKICRVQVHDGEMERDLEQWFRGALLLLAATANMEGLLFDWIPWWQAKDGGWQTLLLRLLLAIGVIESMPDEDVFAVIHRGPPKLKLTTLAGWRAAWRQRVDVLKGLGVLHLRRSSPVFAIMAVVIGGVDLKHPTEYAVGWWCYGLALTQYLIIALITQRDKFTGLLQAFDREAAALRATIVAGASSVVTAGDPNPVPPARPLRAD